MKSDREIKQIGVATQGKLKKMGFPEVKKPSVFEKVDEQFKVDISRLNGRTLSRYMQYATGMFAFSVQHLALVETDVDYLELKMKREKSRLRVLLKGKASTLKEVDAMIDNRTFIVKIYDLLTEKKALQTMLKAQVTIYDAKISMLSRELTRKVKEKESASR